MSSPNQKPEKIDKRAQALRDNLRRRKIKAKEAKASEKATKEEDNKN